MLNLIKNELVLEFRQKSTIGGVIVYVVGTIFVSALCFKARLDKPTWNALFWVITLFTSVTISGKSFLKETGGQTNFTICDVLGRALYSANSNNGPEPLLPFRIELGFLVPGTYYLVIVDASQTKMVTKISKD